MAILSGIIVSVDAFFIGISLGLQKECRFYFLAAINFFLFLMCVAGFFLAIWLGEMVDFDAGLFVGVAFILLGAWCIFKRADGSAMHSIFVAGVMMSVEAMLITAGLTLIFGASLAIPVTIALAHFGYSAAAFFLSRTRYVQRVPVKWGKIISGGALIVYGLLAIFV